MENENGRINETTGSSGSKELSIFANLRDRSRLLFECTLFLVSRFIYRQSNNLGMYRR